VDAPAWALGLLRDARVGRLATASATGQPLVVPVCFVLDEGRIYSAVDAKPKRTRDLRRLRNIRANPRVSLVADVWDEDWTQLAWVIVEGAAAILESGPEFMRAIELLTRKYPQYTVMPLDPASCVVITIEVDRVLAWRASAPR
jgi:PPOX class probable F420-dependent enzyme